MMDGQIGHHVQAVSLRLSQMIKADPSAGHAEPRGRLPIFCSGFCIKPEGESWVEDVIVQVLDCSICVYSKQLWRFHDKAADFHLFSFVSFFSEPLKLVQHGASFKPSVEQWGWGEGVEMRRFKFRSMLLRRRDHLHLPRMCKRTLPRLRSLCVMQSMSRWKLPKQNREHLLQSLRSWRIPRSKGQHRLQTMPCTCQNRLAGIGFNFRLRLWRWIHQYSRKWRPTLCSMRRRVGVSFCLKYSDLAIRQVSANCAAQ